MLKAAEGVCPGCATGCNVRIDYEGSRIYRLKPRYNPEVNGRWMCDKGRMLYKAVHDEKRLTEPMRRSGGELQAMTWQEATDAAGGMLKPGGVDLVLGSPHLSLEEAVLLRRLGLKLAGEDQLAGGVAGSETGAADDLLLSADRTPNRAGLALAGWRELPAAELAEKIRAARGTVLVHGGNPAADESVREALAGCRHVLYIGTHRNETAAAAALALPGAAWAEKAGIFVNRDGRLQAFKSSIARTGEAREDWRILSELLAAAGDEEAPGSLRALRKSVGAQLFPESDFNLVALPARGVSPTAPVAGGEG
jgi:NADH-quinone oxidoreductase subunit G